MESRVNAETTTCVEFVKLQPVITSERDLHIDLTSFQEMEFVIPGTSFNDYFITVIDLLFQQVNEFLVSLIGEVREVGSISNHALSE